MFNNIFVRWRVKKLSREEAVGNGGTVLIMSLKYNLRASDWLLCEEETGAHYQLHRLTYKLWTLFKKKIKVAYFAKKIRTFQNIP